MRKIHSRPGGEHTVTYGLVKGLVTNPADITVVQIDAHGDLADKLNVCTGLTALLCGDYGKKGAGGANRHPEHKPPEYEVICSGERITTFFAHRLEEQWAEVVQTLKNLQGECI